MIDEKTCHLIRRPIRKICYFITEKGDKKKTCTWQKKSDEMKKKKTRDLCVRHKFWHSCYLMRHCDRVGGLGESATWVLWSPELASEFFMIFSFISLAERSSGHWAFRPELTMANSRKNTVVRDARLERIWHSGRVIWSRTTRVLEWRNSRPECELKLRFFCHCFSY